MLSNQTQYIRSTLEASSSRPFKRRRTCRDLPLAASEVHQICCISFDRLMLDAMPANDRVSGEALHTTCCTRTNQENRTSPHLNSNNHQFASQFHMSKDFRRKAKKHLQSGTFPQNKQQDLQPLPCAGYSGCIFSNSQLLERAD